MSHKLSSLKNPKSFHDWRWQLKNSLRSIEELSHWLGLSPQDVQTLQRNFASPALPFSLTPYCASLMKNTVDCPVFLQMVSSNLELVDNPEDLSDPLGEEERKKARHLVHRYPDRVLFFATDRCASYCRFCTRKRWVGQGPTPIKDDHDEAFAYIEQHDQIREIIFSGGDPLLLSSERLDYLLGRSFDIDHIDLIRLHSRMLTFAPMRIDDDLCRVLKKYGPIYLVTHFNHVQEITDHTKEAIDKLIDCGVVLLNQSVLLRGINDRQEDLVSLFRTLAKLRVKPYYLHQCDLIHGAKHFRVPLKRSLELLDQLRGHISGLLVPTLVIDIPGGHGKVPITNSAIVDEDDDFIYLKGFKGGQGAYPKN